MELSLLTFALMALLVVMTPGPTVLFALSNGSRFGIKRAGYGILGAAISDGVLIVAAGLGLGAVLAASAFWFNIVKGVGVVYLIWLGVQMVRSAGGLNKSISLPSETSTKESCSALSIFGKSFLVAVMNPKGYLFFTAFLPQFLYLSKPLFSQYVTLAVIFITIDIAVMTTCAGLGAKVTKLLSTRRALWIDRTSGGFLIAMGLALALVRRSEI